MLLKTSIYLVLMTVYHHTKFGLIWIKQSKVMEGGGPPPPPHVENVLNRPGEIGLKLISLNQIFVIDEIL